MSKMYLFLLFLSVFIQGFFAFFEMASVSFNRVRLQYYVSKGIKRALWLDFLIKHPSRLFGTTLIGITSCLVVGSECARRFYESLGLNPDLSPITQIPLVVIFGELAPMFAARRHPEQAVMIGITPVFAVAKLLTPLTWFFQCLSDGIHVLMGKRKQSPLFLSREEVQMAFEEKEGKSLDEFDQAVNRIFKMKHLSVAKLMSPLKKKEMIEASATLSKARHQLSVYYLPVLPVYHRQEQNVVAIVSLRDLLQLEEEQTVMKVSHPPWFVTLDTSILEILRQFQRNSQSIAIALDSSGHAVGFLTLEQILVAIFGVGSSLSDGEKSLQHVERTLFADMKVRDFNREFHAELPLHLGDTLSDFVLAHLDHFPVKGEVCQIGKFAFEIQEVSLRSIKSLAVRSLSKYKPVK